MKKLFQPLNPKLYNLLQRHLPGGVQVFCSGEAFVAQYKRNPITREFRLEITQRGEEYFGNCPFCGDTRNRLYINHRFGVTDERGEDNLFLSHCYNEECTDNINTQLRLKEMVYRIGRRKAKMQVFPGKILTDSERYDPRPPGAITYLDELPEEHPAIEYLVGRGFDPQHLSKRYGVGYCGEAREKLARHRIYIPFVVGGKLMGWQMRYIGEPAGKFPPKFYSCPGQPAKRMLYNVDRAKKYVTQIMVEGPTDTWRVGNQAFGLIGKKFGPEKRALLKKTAKGATLVVLLDPDQPEHEKAKGKKHQIEEAAEFAADIGYKAVVTCYLPSGTDPGKLDWDVTRECIRAAAKAQGAEVVFGKKALRK